MKPSSALAATAAGSASRVRSFAALTTFASSARFAPAGIGWFIAKLNASRSATPPADEPAVRRVAVGGDERPGVVDAERLRVRARSRRPAAPGSSPRSRSTSSALRLDRHEVGLREVAVVVRLLLRAVRRQRVGVRLVVVGVLLDRAARLVQRDLLARTAASIPRPMKRNEFMFFSSQRVRSSSEPAGRTETLASTAQRALLHPRVRDAELDDRLAQQLEEALGLLGRADVGLR